MKFDWSVLLLGIALILCIAGDVTIVLWLGADELAATGLGALTTLLAGALVWRVKNVINGKKGTEVNEM